jgi:hypothetical protein
MPAPPISSPDDARAVAQTFFDCVMPETPVVLTDVEEFDTCWAVGWISRAYAEGREAMIEPGSAPLIVNRATGKTRMAIAALGLEAQLDPD